MISNITQSNDFFESYSKEWQDTITIPMLEWSKRLDEIKLTNDQIDQIFLSVEKEIKSSIPPGIIKKISDKIKNSKKIKNFDDAFEQKKNDILQKYPKFENIVNILGNKAKKHPIYGAAIIAILTTVTTMITGGIGGFAIGAFLKTSNELLKGEPISKSLVKGVGVGLLGMLAGFGIKELSEWLTTFEINSSTVPGYVDVVHLKLIHETNGVIDLYLNGYVTPQINLKIEKLMKLASHYQEIGHYTEALNIYKNIEQIITDIQPTIDQIVSDNNELSNIVIKNNQNLQSFFKTIASTMQGAITGIVGNKMKENNNLNEASILGLATSIARWSKGTKTPLSAQQLIAAWNSAGKPKDSTAIYQIMLNNGVPDLVLQKIYKAYSIPIPKRKQPKQTTKQSTTVPTEIKTGDDNLDTVVNEILKTKGKDAAIKYLLDLKQQLTSTPASAPAAQSKTTYKHGDIVKASDGQQYKLDIGKTGDRIWLNVKTGSEASDAIDSELESSTVKP